MTPSASKTLVQQLDIILPLYFCHFLCVLNRSLLAAVNTWRAPRAQTTSAPSISFDGTGYLFVMQMADVQRFDSNLRTLTITTRPNEERDGLVLYAYDREVRMAILPQDFMRQFFRGAG